MALLVSTLTVMGTPSFLILSARAARVLEPNEVATAFDFVPKAVAKPLLCDEPDVESDQSENKIEDADAPPRMQTSKSTGIVMAACRRRAASLRPPTAPTFFRTTVQALRPKAAAKDCTRAAFISGVAKAASTSEAEAEEPPGRGSAMELATTSTSFVVTTTFTSSFGTPAMAAMLSASALATSGSLANASGSEVEISKVPTTALDDPAQQSPPVTTAFWPGNFKPVFVMGTTQKLTLAPGLTSALTGVLYKALRQQPSQLSSSFCTGWEVMGQPALRSAPVSSTRKMSYLSISLSPRRIKASTSPPLASFQSVALDSCKLSVGDSFTGPNFTLPSTTPGLRLRSSKAVSKVQKQHEE
mmetsp:Transcript_140917/g.450577  ORF Transcript_140917/g.450577 Transcript_140917/m.450577 type:complete len:358 (+) Transcript_140917:711-1784(+)